MHFKESYARNTICESCAGNSLGSKYMAVGSAFTTYLYLSCTSLWPSLAIFDHKHGCESGGGQDKNGFKTSQKLHGAFWLSASPPCLCFPQNSTPFEGLFLDVRKWPLQRGFLPYHCNVCVCLQAVHCWGRLMVGRQTSCWCFFFYITYPFHPLSSLSVHQSAGWLHLISEGALDGMPNSCLYPYPFLSCLHRCLEVTSYGTSTWVRFHLIFKTRIAAPCGHHDCAYSCWVSTIQHSRRTWCENGACRSPSMTSNPSKHQRSFKDKESVDTPKGIPQKWTCPDAS